MPMKTTKKAEQELKSQNAQVALEVDLLKALQRFCKTEYGQIPDMLQMILKSADNGHDITIKLLHGNITVSNNECEWFAYPTK